MTLVVNITGGENIDQGEQVTLTATVTDASGNTPPGTLQYAWSASRGSFVGATDEASAVYHADFTDPNDIPVTITCNVTRPANASPTVSSGSLTAMTALGITGQILNIFIDPTADTRENARSDIFPGGTIASGSDRNLASNLLVSQLEWNDNTNRFILTATGGGNVGSFFSGNTTQSVFIIFSDGTVLELDSTDIAVTTNARAQWNVTDTTLQQKFVDLDGVKSLLVGVGNSDSIGLDADTGRDTETFTAAALSLLSIEAIDEQNIPVLTEDYELEIDIGGAPERAYVDGDMEGFYHTWDPDNAKIRIKAELVTRLISAALWNVHLVKGTKTLDSQIIYNVVPTAPVIADPGTQKLYKGGSFALDLDIANSPAIARGSGLLSGLKYGPRGDGADGLNIAGRLPADANLTEAAFDAAIYAENNGGHDNLAVPVSIETHQGTYVFDNATDDLLKIGPDAATLHWTYEAPNPGRRNTYDSIVASPDGIYLFSERSDDLLKVSPDGDLLWTFDDAPAGEYDDIIVTQSGVFVRRTGTIYKVHPSTGELIWQSDLPYRINPDGFLVFEGDVYLYNASRNSQRRWVNTITKLGGETGVSEWVYQLVSTVTFPAPVAAGDGVYLREGSTVRKVNVADGTEAWTHSLGATGSGLMADATGVYFLATATMQRLLKVNAADGTRAWTFTLPVPGGHTPVLDSDGFYLISSASTKTVRKVNLTTGAQVWVSASFANVRMEVHPNAVYVFYNFNNNFTRINKSDGSTDWTVTVNRIRQSNGFIEDGSDLYVTAPFGSTNDLVKLDASDGSEAWRYVGSTSGHYASLAIPDFELGA